MNGEEIDGWVERAFKADVEEYSALIAEAKELLAEEHRLRNGSGLVRIDPHAVKKIVVIGDIHGDLESLVHILKQREVATADRIIFLGDYGDRGEESAEVYYLILRLKAGTGERVIMLRGNHEGPPGIPFRPHELPIFFIRRYGEHGKALYRAVKELWEHFPYAVLVTGRYLMVHGGLPADVASVDDLAYARDAHPSSSALEELLWSDPIEGKGCFESVRGAGKLFGEDVTDKVLRISGVKTLIRSHEPCEGIEVRQGGKILTLFSRKGAPYFNTRAAYLVLDESVLREARDANELARKAARIW
ncbi:MAG: metallophosphoesterase family protein [Candidatus Methanospirareceae archaeon]